MVRTFLLLLFCVVGIFSYDWSGVAKVVNDAIADKAFPGATVLLADHTGVLWSTAFGHYTYGVPPPLSNNEEMKPSTLFDMASCTKVTTTTTAIAQFYERGELPLHTPIVDLLGPAYGVNGKDKITVLNCLLHDSGLFPDPVPFWNTPQFNCPATNKYFPPEDFSCSEQTYASLNGQKLQNTVGSTYVYSDLNFLTLMHVVGQLARTKGHIKHDDLRPECRDLKGPGGIQQCYFEAYIRKFVFEEAEMNHSGFRIEHRYWPDAAPTVNDTTYFHSTYQGQVSDGNAYALGGIAGHAGLFSNTLDLHKFMDKIMFPKPNNRFLNKTTIDFFTKEYNHSQSSRALGWNTNDPTVNDQGFDRACGTLSPKSWMHTGYTGTMLCGDPDRKLIVIFLTNRVYPDPNNIKIRKVRQLFSAAVQQAYDKGRQSSSQNNFETKQ